MSAPSIVVVGAGPAGTRATETLALAGKRPTLIDEGWRNGGQIYRRPHPALNADPRKIYGFEAGRAVALHRAFDRLSDRIDYRPNTVVWGASAGRLDLLSPNGTSVVRWDYLIVATGAMDRVVPVEGWTLPGVFTLGGAQIALKSQGCVIGERPVFFGTGPLLYLVAWQYARAGIKPAAVLDCAPRGQWLSSLPRLVSGGGTFAKGAWYLADLTRRNIRMAAGVMPVGVESGPDGAVAGFAWRDRHGRTHESACDGVAMGFGLRSETALLDLCGADFVFDQGQRQWLPRQDDEGRASCRRVYLAGDGASIGGAIAAELSGERAARAVLADIDGTADSTRLTALNRALKRFDRFRRGLEMAFPFPARLAAAAENELTICRCEGVSAGVLRQAATQLGAIELNQVKALTRVGMGRCQGRICGAAAAEIVAAATGQPIDRVGRFRPQMPVKPVPMAALAGRAAA